MITGRGRAASGLAAFGMLAVALTGCSSGEPAASAPSPSDSTAFQTGDCVRLIMALDLQGRSHDSTETVACDTLHHGEVVLADPAYFSGDEALPSETELVNQTDAACADAMQAYSGKRPEETFFQMMVLYPSGQTWEDGDRTLTCIAVAKDLEVDSIAEIEGSIKAASVTP